MYYCLLGTLFLSAANFTSRFLKTNFVIICNGRLDQLGSCGFMVSLDRREQEDDSLKAVLDSARASD